MPETADEIKKETYESRVRKSRFSSAFKISIVIILICLIALRPIFWVWDQSIQERTALREAKNIVLNMQLLGIEYSGMDLQMADGSRENGLSKEGEDRLMDYSGAAGTILAVKWDKTTGDVILMNYERGRFVVHYTSVDGVDSWHIYWDVHTYTNESN